MARTYIVMIGKVSYKVTLHDYAWKIIAPNNSLCPPVKLPAFRFPSRRNRTLIVSGQLGRTTARVALKNDYLPGNFYQNYELRRIHEAIVKHLESGVKEGTILGPSFFREPRKETESDNLRLADIVVESQDGDEARTSFWYEVPAKGKKERLAGFMKKISLKSLTSVRLSRSSPQKPTE